GSSTACHVGVLPRNRSTLGSRTNRFCSLEYGGSRTCGRTVSTRLSIFLFVDGRATVHTSGTALKLGRHPNRFVFFAELYIEGTSTPRHLLQRIAGGDKEAFHALYRRYGPRVTALVRRRIDEREVVEELVQDVFVAAWQTARSYRSDLGDPEH